MNATSTALRAPPKHDASPRELENPASRFATQRLTPSELQALEHELVTPAPRFVTAALTRCGHGLHANERRWVTR